METVIECIEVKPIIPHFGRPTKPLKGCPDFAQSLFQPLWVHRAVTRPHAELKVVVEATNELSMQGNAESSIAKDSQQIWEQEEDRADPARTTSNTKEEDERGEGTRGSGRRTSFLSHP
jgi:hypothetical protein